MDILFPSRGKFLSTVYDTVSQVRVLGDTGRLSICRMNGGKEEGAGREGGWRDVSMIEFARLPFKDFSFTVDFFTHN